MPELKKVIGFRAMVLIVVNSLMGTGIFFLPAIGARYAGPASILAWAILSFIAIYISMCFGELCSLYPHSGGIYEFCKHVYGRFASFLIGWMTIIAGNITIAMLIVGAIQYLLPYNAPFLLITVSVAFIVIFNIIAYRGMRTSIIMLVTFSFITLATLGLLIVPSFFHFDPANLADFFRFPKLSILIAVFFVAETFFGWESPTFLAGEVKDGEKVMPKALVYGTIIITVVSLLFVISSLGAIHWQSFSQSLAPLVDLGRVNYGAAGIIIFTLLVYLSIIGSVADWVVSAPRLILAMAKDKLFISKFSHIHPRYFTPHKAIVFQAIVSIVFIVIGVGSYTTLLHLLVPILLVLYSLVLLSLVILRFKKPDLKRYYTAPFGKVGPLVVISFFMLLLWMWISTTPYSWNILRLSISFAILGLPVYFLLEMIHDPKMMRNMDNLLAYLALYTERFMLPMSVRRKIVELVGIAKDKTVLEFGCSVGTFTLEIAEIVGKHGKIYATDISKRSIEIAEQRVRRRGHRHVTMILDETPLMRVHPDIPVVEIIVSVAKLSYITDLKKVLKEMNNRLPSGGKLCFVEYDKFFHLIPNIAWLSNTLKIRHLFRQAGFSVKVVRKKGLLWENIYIYGKKIRDV